MKFKIYLKVLILLGFVAATQACVGDGTVTPTPPVGDPVVISYIEMFTQTKGWGIGGEQAPLNHVLQTMDGGKSWSDVTPPEPAPIPGWPEKEAVAFFLDIDTAWVTYAPVDGSFPEDTVIWYTTDGGASWAASLPLKVRGDYYEPLFLLFADGDTGWFMVAVGAGMSHQYNEGFKTENGGVTWEKIIDPTDSVYLQTCCKTGLAFADEETGLVTTEPGPYVEAYVEWTDDGGLTWEHDALPLPTTGDYCTGHSPRFFSPQSAVLALDCRNFNLDSTESYLYKTTNGGTDWQIYDYPGGDLIFLDEDEGFALSREIHKTNDGGQTWTYVKTLCWDGQFSFIDADEGWAVGRCEDAIGLYHTDNGGESWDEILPVIQ